MNHMNIQNINWKLKGTLGNIYMKMFIRINHKKHLEKIVVKIEHLFN